MLALWLSFAAQAAPDPAECQNLAYDLAVARAAVTRSDVSPDEASLRARLEKRAAACEDVPVVPACDDTFVEMSRSVAAARAEVVAAAAGTEGAPPLPALAARRRDAWFSLAQITRERQARATQGLDQQALDPMETQVRRELLDLDAAWRTRIETEARASGAEVAWVGMARSFHMGECPWRACRTAQGAGEACGETSSQVTKLEGELQALYTQLVEVEWRAHLALDVHTLAARVQAEVPRLGETDRMALAALLAAELADSPLRPAVARARLAAFLVEVQGRPVWTRDQVAYARLVLAWATTHARARAMIDADVTAILRGFGRLGLADGTNDVLTAAQQANAALQRLRAHDPGPPPPRSAVSP